MAVCSLRDMPELEAAGRLLPAWVGWAGSLVVLAVVLASTALGMAILVGVAARELAATSGKHWTERARASFAPRSFAAASVIGFPIAAVVSARAHSGPFSRVSTDAVALLGATLAAGIASAFVLRLERRRRGQPLPFLQWLGSFVVVGLILFPTWIVAAILAYAAPAKPGTWMLVWGLVGLVAMAACSLSVPLRLLVSIGVIEPASPRLEACVARAAEVVGIPPPRTYEAPALQANALALPLISTLCFLKPILPLLSDAELTAVAAHELGHLREPRSVLALRVLRGYFAVFVALFLAVLGSRAPFVSLVVFWAGLLGWSATKRWAQRLEQRADALALRTEIEPGTYARALEKLHEANLVPAVLETQTSHPSLHDRMKSAGLEPAHPKPAPTETMQFAFLTVGLWALAPVLPGFWLSATTASSDERVIDMRLALRKDSGALVTLARARESSGDTTSALVFARAAAASDPKDPMAIAVEIEILARAGRCSDAGGALGAALSNPHEARLRLPFFRAAMAALANCERASKPGLDSE